MTIWKNAEIQSAAQVADAATKLTGGLPVITVQTAQERYLGMTATEMTRDQQWRDEQTAMNVLDRMVPPPNDANPDLPQ